MEQLQSNGHCDSSKLLPQSPSPFYSTYMSVCKDKNVPAILELIKSKTKLDFVADRIRADQWDTILKPLESDNTLEYLAIRWRKTNYFGNEQTDSEKKPSTIASLIKAVAGCVKHNFVLNKLALEGLPMTTDYLQIICTAISHNNSLKALSLARSNVMDDGCLKICSVVRDLPHIEKINLSHCNLTANAAVSISELVKFQMINRNSEGWMKSLRYRDVDADSVPGLKCLILNGNQLRDDGLIKILSQLKEDMWMKAIEVQNCGISDVGGEAILDCLKFNKTLVVFDASHNRIGNKIQKKIQMILWTEHDNYDAMPKVTNADLREKIEFLEQRLQLEKFNRERANDLNVQLNKNLLQCDVATANRSYEPPSGFTIITSGELNALYKEIEDLCQKKEKEKSDSMTTKGTVNDESIIPNNQEQFGFGDSLTSSERKANNFIPSCRESETVKLTSNLSFTLYSETSSLDVSSKFDEDVTTVNSDEELNAEKREPLFEEYVAFDLPFNHDGKFGDGNFDKMIVDCD